jgi:hypothetical protein
MLLARLLRIVGQDHVVDVADNVGERDLAQRRRRRPPPVVQERNFTPVRQQRELSTRRNQPSSGTPASVNAWSRSGKSADSVRQTAILGQLQ